MKNYNDFINEKIKDLMTGKSDDDIRLKLDKLSPQDRLSEIVKHKLPDKYYLEDEEINDYVYRMNIVERNIKVIDGEIPLIYKPVENDFIDEFEKVIEYVKDTNKDFNELFGNVEILGGQKIVNLLKKNMKKNN